MSDIGQIMAECDCQHSACWDRKYCMAAKVDSLTADRVKNNKDYCALMERYDALTNQLEAARADAKEAEAYAEELEKERDEWKSLAEAAIKDDASKNIYYAELKAKLATCEKYRDAYAECDRIATQAVRDRDAKLAKAVVALRKIEGWPDYRSPSHQDIARTTLAEIDGEKG